MEKTKLVNLRYIKSKILTLVLTFLPVLIYTIFFLALLLKDRNINLQISFVQFHSGILSILVIPLFDIFSKFQNNRLPKNFPWSEIRKSFTLWKLISACVLFILSFSFLILYKDYYLFKDDILSSIVSCIMLIFSILLLDYYNDEIFNNAIADFLESDAANASKTIIAFIRR